MADPRNPIPANPKLLTSLERDELCDILRSIFQQHIRHSEYETDPVRALVEQEIQRLNTRRTSFSP